MRSLDRKDIGDELQKQLNKGHQVLALNRKNVADERRSLIKIEQGIKDELKKPYENSFYRLKQNIQNVQIEASQEIEARHMKRKEAVRALPATTPNSSTAIFTQLSKNGGTDPQTIAKSSREQDDSLKQAVAIDARKEEKNTPKKTLKEKIFGKKEEKEKGKPEKKRSSAEYDYLFNPSSEFPICHSRMLLAGIHSANFCNP